MNKNRIKPYPLAMALTTLRRYFPDRVLGNLLTTIQCLNEATGPISLRIISIAPFCILALSLSLRPS